MAAAYAAQSAAQSAPAPPPMAQPVQPQVVYVVAEPTYSVMYRPMRQPRREHSLAICWAFVTAIFAFAGAGGAWAYDSQTNSSGSSVIVWAYLNYYQTYTWTAAGYGTWNTYWANNVLMNNGAGPQKSVPSRAAAACRAPPPPRPPSSRAGIAFLCLAGILACVGAFMLMASCSDDVRGIAPGSLLVVTLAFCCAIIGTVTGAVGVQQAYITPQVFTVQGGGISYVIPAVFSQSWGYYYRPAFGLAITACVLTFLTVLFVGSIACSPAKPKPAPPAAAGDPSAFSGQNPTVVQQV